MSNITEIIKGTLLIHEPFNGLFKKIISSNYFQLFSPESFEAFPNLLEYMERIENLPNVKAYIQGQEGIPRKQQRLSFAGTQLKDGRTLDEYNIDDKSTLDLAPI